MAAIAKTQASSPGEQPGFREDARAVAYWVSLGATAGGLGGLLAGGFGGRLAMFVLRLTSDDSVRGIESDDGFIIGRFDLTSTLNLLFTTMFLGSLFALFVVLGRQFLPSRWMTADWAAAGATLGGASLINGDGVDFTLLEPHWLAVAMFIVIPGAGAALIAWLVERIHLFWWKRRKATAIAALAAVPAVIAFPITIIVMLGSAIWLLGGRVERLRGLPRWQPARIAALVVFAGLIGVGAFALSDKMRDVL
ncbi:MAG: hypothetical protein ACR2HN_03060 [Tepidiformaceae bacterium]